MGIFLRIMLILLLILSIAALVIGLDLFQQREILKGRLQLAENTLSDVARTIESEDAEDLAERDLPTLRLDRDQLRSFYRLDAQGKPVRDIDGNRISTGPETMAELLSRLRGRAAVQYTRLNDTRETLSQTRVQLADTRRELTDTQSRLAQTQRDLEQTRNDLNAARGTIRSQTEQIAGLNRDKERMQTEIDDQKDSIVELRNNVAVLEMEKERDQRIISDQRATIDALQREPDEDIMAGQMHDVAKGFKGQVMFVNPDWNFVILDLTLEDRTLRPTLVLHVQRADKLVGKVRISEIKGDDERRLAVADIISDWLQSPIQEGDRVFF